MKIIDCIQRSEVWHAARIGRPTASSFDRIITSTGKDSSQWINYATALVAESIRPDMAPAFIGNVHTDRGNDLEPEARDAFTELTGFDVREVGFVVRDDTIVGCSPDGLIYHDNKPIAGLEIKCPLAINHCATVLANELPTQYKVQVHGSMAVTGLPAWYFFSYCPGFVPFLLKVEADEFTATVSNALDRFLEFYADHRKRVIPLLVNPKAKNA